MIKELEQDINLNKINHAYFLECNNEDVALKEAKQFAEAILGGKLENNPDYKILETDEKSIKVDQVRELQKDVLKKPIGSERKVYIISQANKLNISAQNCLLKTIEEPPEYVTLILISSSIYSVIGTVRSRVKAVKILVSEEQNVRSEVVEILDTLKYKNRVEVLKYADFFEKNKDDIIEIFHEMLIYCNKRILEYKNELLKTYDCDTIIFAKYVPIINFAEKRINENSNFSMTIDDMLLKMRGVKNDEGNRSKV